MTGLNTRSAATSRVLEVTKCEDQSVPRSDVAKLADELAPEFFALALAALVVEMLGHTMHYSSNLDKDSLEGAAVAAARAACEGNATGAEEKLQRAFDLLGQARDYYYPVESFFLDVTLLAASVWGRPLMDRLGGPIPTSVLLTAAQARDIAGSNPDSLQALHHALAESKTTLVGGETEEYDQMQVSLEGMLDELREARGAYESLLGRAPTVYGRFRGSFSPMLPGALDGLGYAAALLVAFDGSSLPKADHSRFRWEGADGSAINALGLAPLDAGEAGSFLQLAQRLGHSMQNDHVATVLFASWPGHESEYYEDLLRAAKRCPTLGRFVTLDEYFDATQGSDLPAMFDADAFREPSGGLAAAGESVTSQRERIGDCREADRMRLLGGLADLVGPAADGAGTLEEPTASLNRLADAVCRATAAPGKDRSDGLLSINLSTQPKSVCFADPRKTPRAPAPDRYAADVPGMGFGWQPAGPSAEPPVPLASGQVLRNEHFEILINHETGGIGAIHDYRRRLNRLSQQLAVRLAGESRRDASSACSGSYTKMVADDVRVTASTPACGEITSTGRLLDDRGGEVAHFQQSTRLVRGSRLVELCLRLDPVDPRRWSNEKGCAAVRWAWRDAPAELRRSIHGASFLTKRNRIHAADFVEVVEDNGRLVVFTGVPAEHIHDDENRLDTLWPAASEAKAEQTFDVAVGIDLECAAVNWAHQWLSEPLVVPTSGVPAARRAWWFLCSSASVRWTALGPLKDGRSGFFARLQELTGRYVKARIESFRPIRSARKTNLRGEPQIELPVRDGRIDLQLAGYQWVQIEAEWV
jgi:alpha-mannosidase